MKLKYLLIFVSRRFMAVVYSMPRAPIPRTQDIGQLLVRSGPIAIHEGLPRWKNRSVSLTSDPSTAPKMTPIHEIRRRQ